MSSPLFIDEKSELGYEELMNEAMFLRTFQEKVQGFKYLVTYIRPEYDPVTRVCRRGLTPASCPCWV